MGAGSRFLFQLMKSVQSGKGSGIFLLERKVQDHVLNTSGQYVWERTCERTCGERAGRVQTDSPVRLHVVAPRWRVPRPRPLGSPTPAQEEGQNHRGLRAPAPASYSVWTHHSLRHLRSLHAAVLRGVAAAISTATERAGTSLPEFL